ncbi:MAG TPA: hypothetical protein VNZ03_04295 [Terriglobales bacterium]|nr:hypothetical protein [Terriglobales bacterium]
MRTIERTNLFKRDFKREKSGQHKRDLDALVSMAVLLLVEDKPLLESTAITLWAANGETIVNAI